MWPRLGSNKLVIEWMLVTLVASIIAAIDGGWLASWTALIPSRVLHGEVWRLVTWPFVQPNPTTLLFTLIAIYKCGSELAGSWDERRLQRFMTHIVIAAAVVTCVLSLLAGRRYLPQLGGWAAIDALVIAWARQFPKRTLPKYSVLRGRSLVTVTIGVTIVFAIYVGPIAFAPELAACAFAATYRPAWLRL